MRKMKRVLGKMMEKILNGVTVLWEVFTEKNYCKKCPHRKENCWELHPLPNDLPCEMQK